MEAISASLISASLRWLGDLIMAGEVDWWIRIIPALAQCTFYLAQARIPQVLLLTLIQSPAQYLDQRREEPLEAEP